MTVADLLVRIARRDATRSEAILQADSHPLF
jgi:hypothetical protein